jgi:hypothetical protein
MEPVLDLDGYQVTDGFFGCPFVDVDEWREVQSPHRFVHGGFEGTDTRFAFYFPPAERYRRRMYQPLAGANAGSEITNTTLIGAATTGGTEMGFRLGGYVVESNMGHIGDVMDPKAGPDPTVYGWRAAAETARFSKFAAAQVLGHPPTYSYVFGGSGGARRSPLCLAYAPGVWDAALPYMGDAMDGDYGDMSRPRGAAPHFSCMFNVQRVLGSKIHGVIDAMAPGGNGDPFEGLGTHQREELANLYRLGYPRGDEFMIAQPMGQIWLWCSMAERLQIDDAEYFERFWTRPGHVGHDFPELVEHDLIDVEASVAQPLNGKALKALLDQPPYEGVEFDQLRNLAGFSPTGARIALAVQLHDVPDGYRLGAGITILTGAAAGRRLFCMAGAGDVFLCSGEGEAANLGFTGVVAGDRVRVDNRAFLAYCYYYRHHHLGYEDYQFMRLDGRPVYEQYPQPEMSPFMGVLHTGRFDGKMLWVHHTHDSSLWPPQGLGMKNNVEREFGTTEATRRFRLRWSENAEHVPPSFAASQPGRANNTWLIDYLPLIEQSLVDLAGWVEQGIEPSGTNFEYLDGKISLPPTAAERGGIQPVVSVTANGSARADVAVGDTVSLEVRAEAPTGTIISASWDYDGSGSYPYTHTEIDGTTSRILLTTNHAFDRPGAYFVTCLVESSADSDPHATSRRLPNLASARVVVS